MPRIEVLRTTCPILGVWRTAAPGWADGERSITGTAQAAEVKSGPVKCAKGHKYEGDITEPYPK